MRQADDLRTEGNELKELVGSLNEADWQRATPFKSWTVNDVIAHLQHHRPGGHAGACGSWRLPRHGAVRPARHLERRCCEQSGGLALRPCAGRALARVPGYAMRPARPHGPRCARALVRPRHERAHVRHCPTNGNVGARPRYLRPAAQAAHQHGPHQEHRRNRRSQRSLGRSSTAACRCRPMCPMFGWSRHRGRSGIGTSRTMPTTSRATRRSSAMWSPKAATSPIRSWLWSARRRRSGCRSHSASPAVRRIRPAPGQRHWRG